MSLNGLRFVTWEHQSHRKRDYVILNDGQFRADIQQDGQKVRKVALGEDGKNIVERDFAGERVTKLVDQHEFNLLFEALLI